MIPPLHTATVDDIRHMLTSSELCYGDCWGVRNGERGWANWVIRRVQYRALSHEGIWMTEATRRYYAGITHTLTMAQKRGTGKAVMAEMSAPRARTRPLESLIGCEVLIRRPFAIQGVSNELEALGLIAEYAMQDVANQTRYSFRELGAYLFDWAIFQDAKRDVCSGRYMHWGNRSGHFDAEPHEWYPARCMADRALFFNVARFRITG